MTDEPSKIATAIKIAKNAHYHLAKHNFCPCHKSICTNPGALGITTMWAAVFADVGVTLIAILNSIRILKLKIIKNAWPTLNLL